MKKLCIICLAAVFALALAGCGSQSEPEPTTEAVATTEAPATTEPTTTTEAVTYQNLYKSQLDTLIDQGGVTGGRLVDMDGDGTPEMLVIQSMTAKLYTVKDGAAVSIYEGTVGLKYGQTDAYYEVLLNESISPVTLLLFNASDEWVDENITAVTVSDGTASTRNLKAATNGENDTPAREELETFSIDGAAVDAGEYNNEYNRLTTGADSIDPTAAGLESLQAALEAPASGADSGDSE